MEGGNKLNGSDPLSLHLLVFPGSCSPFPQSRDHLFLSRLRTSFWWW